MLTQVARQSRFEHVNDRFTLRETAAKEPVISACSASRCSVCTGASRWSLRAPEVRTMAIAFIVGAVVAYLVVVWAMWQAGA